ncbi:MAG: cold-shock protein [Salinivirgaceae bacterium]|jgi:CspA family cold shock protein|nr:cold-shock protein [Salinivirgaceae bacterium]
MNTGTVKWYNETKGFGFIVNEENKDIFVHKSGLKNTRTLEPDQNVQFEFGEGEKGPIAVNVEAI